MVDDASTSIGGLTPGLIATRIGQQVRSWRLEAGVSEAELAEALQLPAGAVAGAETGEVCFTAEQIVTICQVFTVKPSRFFDNVV